MNKPELTLLLGPSGSGKTHTMLYEVLENEYKGIYDYIFILCPNIWINETYKQWLYLESDSDIFGLQVNADQLDSVIKLIIKIYQGSKTAIVVDDMSNDNEQHKNNNMLTYLAFSGRHHGISTFILSQKLNSISTGIRDNATRVIFFKTHNKRSIKILKDEFFGYLQDEAAEQVILKKLSKHKYIDINLNNDPASYTVV